MEEEAVATRVGRRGDEARGGRGRWRGEAARRQGGGRGRVGREKGGDGWIGGGRR